MSDSIQLIEPDDNVINTDAVAHIVSTKLNWSDPWEVQDYIIAESCQQSVGPTIPRAVLYFEYGDIKRYDQSSFSVDEALESGEKYVRIQLLDKEPLTIFIGVMQATSKKVEPPVDGTIDSGRQTLTAFGLEQLFSRKPINQSHFDLLTVRKTVDRVYSFNETYQGGARMIGNRSTANGEDGVYLFSVHKEVWNHRQMADYLLKYFAPDAFTITLTGQVDALENLETVVKLTDGMDLNKALSYIIPQAFGLGWRRVTNDDSTINIEIFTIVDKPLGDLPANENLAKINITDGLDMKDCIVKTQEQAKVDEIHIIGGYMISCFTLSYDDGTLEDGWTSSQETAYNGAADDLSRSADEFKGVYQYHRVPSAFDFEAGDGVGGAKNTIIPTINDDGTIDTSTAAPCFQLGKKLLSRLPFLEHTLYTGGNVIDNSPSGTERDQQKSFAVILNPDNAAAYIHTEKLGALELHPANLHVSTREMALFLEPTSNHQFALGSFTGDIDKAVAEVDYRTLIATVAIETDHQLKYVHKLDSLSKSENRKIKILKMPAAQLWYVTPGTVWGIVNGALQYYTGDGELRNDKAMLKTTADYAAAWFGRERNAINYSESTLKIIAEPGTMILTASSSNAIEEIGTVVTMLEFDLKAAVTTIKTNYLELSFTSQPRKLFRAPVTSAAPAAAVAKKAGNSAADKPVVSGPSQIEADDRDRRLDALESLSPAIRTAASGLKADPTFVKWDA